MNGSCGVVWQMLLAHLEETQTTLPHLERVCMRVRVHVRVSVCVCVRVCVCAFVHAVQQI